MLITTQIPIIYFLAANLVFLLKMPKYFSKKFIFFHFYLSLSVSLAVKIDFLNAVFQSVASL